MCDMNRSNTPSVHLSKLRIVSGMIHEVGTHCSCSLNVRNIALLPTSNTCTVPSSLPATINFPSFLNSAPLAVPLNRDIVLTTLPVLGA